MDFVTQIIPAIIILFANLLGGNHNTNRWKIVTAIFGWTACASFILYFIALYLFPSSKLTFYLLQLFGFSLLTALSRDYERILKPFFKIRD